MSTKIQMYDVQLDKHRTVTQADVDDLQAFVQKLGKVRASLLGCVTEFFPTIAEDIALGSTQRRNLHREFYREHGRAPNREELSALVSAFLAPATV